VLSVAFATRLPERLGLPAAGMETGTKAMVIKRWDIEGRWRRAKCLKRKQARACENSRRAWFFTGVGDVRSAGTDGSRSPRAAWRRC